MHKTLWRRWVPARWRRAAQPDQFSNYKATGFNGFVDTASVQCAPLQVGPMVITRNYEPPNYAAAQYGVWLDQTSNLYYKRITAEAYIQNINNLFPGERTAARDAVPGVEAATAVGAPVRAAAIVGVVSACPA